MDEKRPFIAVYMMTNKPRGTLYIGVTNSLYRRVFEHREGLNPHSFTKRHGLTRLVWWKGHESMGGAIRREKTLKSYLREWKINLIERENPHWDDLYLALTQGPIWRHDPKPLK